MTKNNFEITGDDMDKVDGMDIQVQGSAIENEVDINGQIRALESQIESLESKNDEVNLLRIEALKRELQKLKDNLTTE